MPPQPARSAGTPCHSLHWVEVCLAAGMILKNAEALMLHHAKPPGTGWGSKGT